MSTEEVLQKWFDWMLSHLQGARTYTSQAEQDRDNLSTSVTALVKTYTDSILVCLNKEKKMPAKALMRVVADISLKCIWCLRGYEQSPEEFSSRREKWRRSSLREYQKQLNRHREVLKEEYSEIEKQAVLEEIERRLKLLEPLGLSAKDRLTMPEGAEVWKQCAAMNKSALYDDFHSAIHPDLVVLTTLTEEDGYRVLHKSDVDEPVERLKTFCLVIVGHLFDAISDANKWDFGDVMKQDIAALRGQ